MAQKEAPYEPPYQRWLKPGTYRVTRDPNGILTLIDAPHEGRVVNGLPRQIQKLAADARVDTIVSRYHTYMIVPKKAYVPPHLEPLYTKADIIELLEREARACLADVKKGVAAMRRRNERAHRVNGAIGVSYVTAGAFQLLAEQLRDDSVRMPATSRVTPPTPPTKQPMTTKSKKPKGRKP